MKAPTHLPRSSDAQGTTQVVTTKVGADRCFCTTTMVVVEHCRLTFSFSVKSSFID